jgi:hypothetical protein
MWDEKDKESIKEAVIEQAQRRLKPFMTAVFNGRVQILQRLFRCHERFEPTLSLLNHRFFY